MEDGKNVREQINSKLARPIVFAWLLCLAMLVGEIAGGGWNPVSVVFYSFLPAVLWMMADQQKRDARAITDLQARIAQLQESRQGSPGQKFA